MSAETPASCEGARGSLAYLIVRVRVRWQLHCRDSSTGLSDAACCWHLTRSHLVLPEGRARVLQSGATQQVLDRVATQAEGMQLGNKSPSCRMVRKLCTRKPSLTFQSLCRPTQVPEPHLAIAAAFHPTKLQDFLARPRLSHNVVVLIWHTLFRHL